MKKIKNVELTEDRKIPFIIIGVAVFMLIFSVLSIDITAEGVKIGFSSLGSIISVLPLTIGVSTFMMLKTKKPAFCEFPCYIISAIIVMAFIVLLFFNLLDNFKFLGIMLCVLMAYPYIITGLTARGCVYNKMFALAFAGILLVISLFAVIAVTIVLGGFSFTYLVLPLMYAELILTTFCFNLKPINKKNN